MNIYQTIRKLDVANGPGCRVSIFVSGCRNNCKGCFNKEAQSFSFGAPLDDKLTNEIISDLKDPYIEGLSVLGGEPMEPENQAGLLPLVERVRRELPNKTIWLWTGYLYPYLPINNGHWPFGKMIPFIDGVTDKLLKMIDVVVDGPFVEELKDISLQFRGSSNQRIIYLQKDSLEIASIVSK